MFWRMGSLKLSTIQSLLKLISVEKTRYCRIWWCIFRRKRLVINWCYIMQTLIHTALEAMWKFAKSSLIIPLLSLRGSYCHILEDCQLFACCTMLKYEHQSLLDLQCSKGVMSYNIQWLSVLFIKLSIVSGQFYIPSQVPGLSILNFGGRVVVGNIFHQVARGSHFGRGQAWESKPCDCVYSWRGHSNYWHEPGLL